MATATTVVGSVWRLIAFAAAFEIAAGTLAAGLGAVADDTAEPALPAAEPSFTEPVEPAEPEELDELVPLDDEPVPGDEVEALPDPVEPSAELAVD